MLEPNGTGVVVVTCQDCSHLPVCSAHKDDPLRFMDRDNLGIDVQMLSLNRIWETMAACCGHYLEVKRDG